MFLYLNNDVVSPLLTSFILHCIIPFNDTPVLVILICMSSPYSGLEILHQKEGLITEAECERIGRSVYNYDTYKVVAQMILAKSINESLRICEICEQYRLLDSHDMKLIKGVSVCDLCIMYTLNLYSSSSMK